ncbi:essential MCU regulator, mitochondrial [Caerostris extrusa]|uniref:Essential MCU regulator, mitochondrial n=1 Tax=Caerostris extrusa TaxID=172846 RepID=A0AAV4Y5X0_CAEEX|nr:essential MCU regulator, mitochondrial [Caerostris extrusa]
MAARIMRFAKNVTSDYQALKTMSEVPVRCIVTTETGAVLPKPAKMQFGLLRVLLTVLPGLYLGATISKEGAAFLEENDIFVPDEDDDED